MKQRFLFCLLLLSYTLFAQNNGETRVSLDGEWKFKTDPGNTGESSGWFNVNHSNAGWDSMAVPGNWDLRNEYAHYAGKAWYRKHLEIPSDWKNKLVRVLFEGVYNDSKVWLNGKLLGTNDLGFLPFEFDISSHINFGGTNTLVVCADNTFRRGALWNWGGIRRPVSVVATSPVYIQNFRITPEVDLKKNSSKISIEIHAENKTDQRKEITGEVVLSSIEGFSKKIPYSSILEPNKIETIKLSATLNAKQVHLWSFDDPFLYQCKISLQNKTELLHHQTARFGIRKIEVDNRNFVFKLNGKPVRVMGFNLVPDDRTTGSTLPLWRVKEDIDLLKSFGANFARLTHVPMHHEMLDYLDEKGILVVEEIPLWGFDVLANKSKSQPFNWARRLITAHYNHPSVIGWSVGNEIGESPGVMEYVDSAIKNVKSLDTFHLALMVSHTADRGRDPIEYSDFGLINKYGKQIGNLADKMHQLHPNKLLFYSEYGYGQMSEDLDADVDARGMLDSMRFKPYLMGGSLWTFNDYRSSYIYTKEFSENRPWGVVDVFRQKKKAFYSFRKEYAPVRKLNLTIEEKQDSSIATIVLEPRSILDLPAYELKDYFLVLKALDEKGNLVSGDFRKLPFIQPGSKSISEKISWIKNDFINRLQVELLSPLNYSVYDTVVFFEKPAAPVVKFIQGGRTQMNELRENSASIRLVMEKQEPHVYYKATYAHNGLKKETAKTLNNFIEIPGLAFHESYNVSIIAINGNGESTPTNIGNVKIETGIAPPVIYYTEPADKGFFVGYRSHPEDYLYGVEYYKDSDTSNRQFIQTAAKGVLFVPALENGTSYSFRIKVIKQNSSHSSWSEVYKVTPDGNQMPSPPEVKGLVKKDNAALVLFQPVKKATGYILEYREMNAPNWQSAEISSSLISHFILPGLKRNVFYEFRMQTINQYGKSEYSSIIKSN